MPQTHTLRITVEPERHVLSGGLQPYLFRSSQGTLVLQAQIPYPKGHTLPGKNIYGGLPGTVVSRDGGHSWQLWFPSREQVGDTMPADLNIQHYYSGATGGPVFEGAIVQLRTGAIRIFDWITEGPSPSGDFTGQMWDSSDDWQTVQGPKPFHIHLPQAVGGHDDAGNPYAGLTLHRTVLELLGGDLLACVYCWFQEDKAASSYQPKMNRWRCVLLRSGDQGLNWRYVSTIAADAGGHVGQEGFDEPVMVQLSRKPHAGRLICLMRTGPSTFPIYQTHSDDEGQTWMPPRALVLRGVDPAVIEMSDGTLVCSYGYRSTPSEAEHGNHVAFSTDQGETWGHVTHLPLEAHSTVLRSTCYTSVQEVEPGKLLVVFDVGQYGLPIRYVGQRFVRVRAT